MLNTPTMDKLRELKLHGMLKGLQDQQTRSGYEGLDFEERLGLLTDLEMSERENRRLKTRLQKANLRQQACMEDINYSKRRGKDISTIKSLHDGRWIKDALNVILTGSTGVGKSYLACAIVHRACMLGYNAQYFRASTLFGELELAAEDGRYKRLMKALSKQHLIVIDDWGLSKLSEQGANDLLEILEDRYNRRSTVIAGQLPVEHWYEMIGNPTLADAILDRLIHNSYRINLEGDSMRKEQRNKRIESLSTP